MIQEKLIETMDKKDLIDFLQDNGDIFIRHPELLELLDLSDDRGTASLLERQVSTLKNRLSSFQSQQFEFIEVARENEQISDSFSQIICQLIGFSNLSEFASELPKALRQTFEIDEVAFKTSQAASRRPNDNLGYEDAVRRLSNKQAVCDDRWPRSIMALFFSDKVKSAALLPMKSTQDGDVIGILALGSSDPKRYTNELGTAHLNRLGLMAGICLARLQPAV
ncbi:MAG: hypothetical protein ACI8PV_001617 [Dinoroseobacter sp.]